MNKKKIKVNKKTLKFNLIVRKFYYFYYFNLLLT